ncbi:MAG: thiol:disulfide interchange protein DsbA [Gammaproteobacteria bacterium]|jgi:thiol:disulfide interchange protein DsbA
MFKQWVYALAGLLIIATPLQAQQVYVAGVDYKIISPSVPTSQSDKVVVTEVFWYGCPHCFRFEPFVEKWAANLREGVVFEQVPSVINPRWADHARAYYAMNMMGIQTALHRKMFDEIHLKRRRLNSLDTIAEFVAENGYDEAKFREFYNSFPVDTQLRKGLKTERKYGHQGVPAIIVNGKYLATGSMAGSNDRLIRIIDFLVDQEIRAN